MVKRILSLMFLFVILFYAGCGGNDPNPVAVYRAGDESRSCESLRVEIAENETVITEKMVKDADKFWTNLIWMVTFFPGMDVKEAEKNEAEALRHRNDYLKHLVAERGCKDVVAAKLTTPVVSDQESGDFSYQDWESQPSSSVSVEDEEMEILISALWTNGHSFQWLRKNTSLNFSDEQFEQIISDYPELFRSVTVNLRRTDGSVIKQIPGMSYIGE